MTQPALARIVGPPGSGKTLLITSLTEALRQRGHRVASAAVREDGTATVITLPNGGRVTIERVLVGFEVRDVAAMLDPNIDLLLAEGFEDAGIHAVELSPEGGSALTTAPSDLLAVVASTQVAGDFATFGPGETHGLAALIEQRVFGLPPPGEPGSSKFRGLLGRLRGR
jgi:molybdopterin-guanine dinucleotide biosynthesis protein